MFGFLKKRAAAPQSRRGSSAAAHAQGPDAPTTPRTPELDRKFADRPTNANVAALVYLYAATRLLELLVRRGVINFGEGVTKSDEAKVLAKANLSFINDVTIAHAQRTTDFGEFRVGIQDRVSATSKKLAALLRAADQRIGSPDSELAEGLPWAAKVHIAVALDGFSALFDVDNPERDACRRMRADTTSMDKDEAHRAYIDELLDAISRGNGAKAYAFIRMAGYSLAHLAATTTDRAAIAERVSGTIAEHGALDSSLLSFDDVPDGIETATENMTPLFAKETISLQRSAGAYALAAAAMLGWMRAEFSTTPEIGAALDAADMPKADGVDAQFGALADAIAQTTKPLLDAGGEIGSVAQLGPLRNALKTLQKALQGVSNARTLASNNVDATPGDLAVARLFAASAAGTLGQAVAKGEAEFNDRPIAHTDARPLGFEWALAALSAAGDDSADCAKADVAMAENMIAYFSHHAFAAAAA